ncbi:nuclease-related domain-containing protein [Cytobacillus praedii]|uniref:nuclease-related domain-containing protein n=1 Tax=Cytobacillus praedii TaxID=1742358 RepID=UPI0007106F97|nr:nuclease-related domain-containing protein [Cytobacillus praedii]
MLSKILKGFSKKKPSKEESITSTTKHKDSKAKVTPARIGEIGEYKINIQLDQLSKNCRYLQDILIPNRYSKSGFSQIDHIVITPYTLFVIETKNYTGTIYGDRNRAKWCVNGKFPMMNPFNQNYGHIQAIKAVLETTEDAQYVSMVSFNRRCTFKMNEELRKIQSNDLIVYDTELSEFINRKISVLKLLYQKPIYSNDEMQDMYNKLMSMNITDSKIKDLHVERLKNMDSEKAVRSEETVSTCFTCGKEVSEKVKSYCFSNNKRFNGNIYCYEHQEPRQ